MKRTPLRRKVGLQRSGKLAAMSAKKKAMQPAYRKAIEEAKYEQISAVGYTFCVRCKRPGDVEPHHTQSRRGKNLLVFVLLDRKCHATIHANTKQARIDGWLK